MKKKSEPAITEDMASLQLDQDFECLEAKGGFNPKGLHVRAIRVDSGPTARVGNGQLACWSDNTVRVWDTHEKKLIHFLPVDESTLDVGYEQGHWIVMDKWDGPRRLTQPPAWDRPVPNKEIRLVQCDTGPNTRSLTMYVRKKPDKEDTHFECTVHRFRPDTNESFVLHSRTHQRAFHRKTGYEAMAIKYVHVDLGGTLYMHDPVTGLLQHFSVPTNKRVCCSTPVFMGGRVLTCTQMEPQQTLCWGETMASLPPSWTLFQPIAHKGALYCLATLPNKTSNECQVGLYLWTERADATLFVHSVLIKDLADVVLGYLHEAEWSRLWDKEANNEFTYEHHNGRVWTMIDQDRTTIFSQLDLVTGEVVCSGTLPVQGKCIGFVDDLTPVIQEPSKRRRRHS